MIVIIGVVIVLAGILMINLGQLSINPTEKPIWFKYTPICCDENSWDKAYENTANAANATYPESLKIKNYFQDQGITIIQSMTNDFNCTYCPAMIYGKPYWYSYYFLVPASDENNTLSLGFTKVDTLPSNLHSVDIR